VIGASFGGVAALVAAGTPDAHLIEAVVLVDVVPRMRPAGIERIRSFMTSHPDGFGDLDEARAAVASYLPHRQAWGSGLERNLRRRPDGRLRWHWDPALLAIDPSLPDTVALIEDSVHRITVPISLVRGLLSDVVDDAGVEALRALCPHLSVVDLPRASHTAAADDNDAFAEAVTARLVGHRAEP
jgi:hypothetical protein